MPEPMSAELEAEATAFAVAMPASVEMPAGSGKTHLLSATTRHIVEGGGRVLVLTHTNAGVSAINSRLKRFGVTKGAHVSTITSFAFRLARAYPQLGQLQVPRVIVAAQSMAYVQAAIKVASSENIQAVLSASYTHLLVDEYQDCNQTHHAFISAVRRAVPAAGVLGDPLQAIFGFAERLVDWTAVREELPPHSTSIEPHRWSGHNESLGQWLLEIRPRMAPGHLVRWNEIALPVGVTFRNIAGNPQGVTDAARSKAYRSDQTVLIIAARPETARAIAGKLKGAFSVMEEVAGKFMAKSLGELAAATPDQYALWLFDLAKSCCCGHRVLDPGTLRGRYATGKTAGDLLESSDKRAGAEPAIYALDVVVRQPTLTNLAAAMDTIPTSPALQLHSHEAWYDIRTSIQGAISHGSDTRVLVEELAKVRDALRYGERRERRRTISRTLLVKGLEYDHVIIADVGEHAKVNDLYVALTRARKSITILGSSDTLRLQPSPRGH